MKAIIFVPVKDYFQSRKKLWNKFILPFVVSIVALFFAFVIDIGSANDIYSAFSEFISVQINVVSILIAFSVAIITILVSADSENIRQLKDTPSDKEMYKPINRKQLSLFQILLSNIAYNAILEVFFLIALIAISLIKILLPIFLLKYISSVCIFLILHILIVLLESVAEMYLTFWSKKD